MGQKMREINMALRLTHFRKLFFLLICLTPLHGCGGGGGGSPSPSVPPPVANQSPGGLWFGTDSGGSVVVAFVTETGRFHFIDEFLNQGAGILNVNNGDNIASNFQLVAFTGSTFQDGTTLADCTLSGMVTERQTMTITVNCTTTAGLQNQIMAVLNYDTLYERNSSLATIAGMFVDLSGIVTTISSDGTFFKQDPVTGCVTNGQFSIIDSNFDLYDIEFGLSNCTGQFAIFNGTSFVGLATLDNTFSPELLVASTIGDVAGILVAMFIIDERI